MVNAFTGIVTKTGAMRRTVTVTVHRNVEHPKLLKTLHRSTKFLVHDEEETARIGDKVTIIHGKPFSKRKHYSIQSIDQTAPVIEGAETRPLTKVEIEMQAEKRAKAEAKAKKSA